MAKILFATTAEGVKFYPVTITDAVVHISGNTQTKLSELLNNFDTQKADKLVTEAFSADKSYAKDAYVTYNNELYQFTDAHSAGAWVGTDATKVSGNFFAIDKNGNLVDSGSKASDFKTKQTAVADSDATTDGNATTFVDAVTQDANGEITVHKKTIPNVSASTSGVGGNAGLMTAAQAEQLAGLVSTGGEVNILEGVQVNGSDLTITNKKVNVTIAESENNGKVTVNGTDVAIHGLGSAAYTDSTAYEASGTVATEIAKLDATVSQTASTDGLALSITEVDGVITAIGGSIAANTYDAYGAAADVLGTASDTSTDNTVYGAKAYADSLVVGGVIYKGTVDGTTNVLPTTGYKTGWEYAVTVNGTYAGKVCQAGDFLIANKDYTSGAVAANDWDIKQGTVAVTNSNASLVIGTATKIGEVEGVEIKVTQVEDMTKIEAIAVADTTDYADVTSLFTAPA